MNPNRVDVALRHITKRYDNSSVVSDVDLEVESGEFVSILGPSGCGKTTTLRMIAGFVTPNEGDIEIRGSIVNSVPPHQRDFGMVFQSYALFPHLSVFENVAFGLKITRVKKTDLKERVAKALGAVGLTGFEGRLPKKLSGGQQQRVALARAIVMNPAVLLLDEPLSNLDLKMRQSMRLEIKQLQHRLGVTTLFVTHDQEEALTMSDRIVVMNAGRVEQIGTPREIYEKPATAFVANFIGVSNLIDGVPTDTNDGRATFMVGDGLQVKAPATGVSVGAPSKLLVRPEKIQVCSSADSAAEENILPCTVENVVYMGSMVRYYLSINGVTVICDEVNRGGTELSVGNTTFVRWNPEDTIVLSA